uniref:RRM domain-containing protein n=1 Tax=Zea mays TaxID=4577 RepID=C0P9V8_MAIZE|nr:unknown [Zea mays]
MAAFNKLGGLLRHSALVSGITGGSSPAVFNAARLMSTKLFIGGLDWGVDDVKLREAFSSFGEVTEARVITDRETGRSRGFGFVNYSDSDAAKEAISAMDGKEIDGRQVRVNMANERPLRSTSPPTRAAAASSIGWCTGASSEVFWNWTWCWGPGSSSTCTPWTRPTSAPSCKCSTSKTQICGNG